MRIALNVLGVVLVSVGTVWFFQGINVLPGSFMTGQIEWAAYGAIAVITGSFSLIAARRLRRPPNAR